MKTDSAIEFRQKHMPYSDGSGYKYEISVVRRPDGEMVIVIDACGGIVEIEATAWPAVAQSINDAATFVTSRS